MQVDTTTSTKFPPNLAIERNTYNALLEDLSDLAANSGDDAIRSWALADLARRIRMHNGGKLEPMTIDGAVLYDLPEDLLKLMDEVDGRA